MNLSELKKRLEHHEHYCKPESRMLLSLEEVRFLLECAEKVERLGQLKAFREEA